MKHNVEAFKKYYINATKEEVIEDMFLDSCNLQQEIERLNNIINRIKSIYSSLCFSAPENDYIFIEQLGEVLQELKDSCKEEVPYNTYEEQQDYLWESIDEDNFC